MVDWRDPQQLEAAIELYKALPASEVARRLGITKNSVIGAMNRAGITKRPHPIIPPPRSFPPPDGCLWPCGDPGSPDFHFCGAPKVPGPRSLYCQEHTERAYLNP